VKTSLEHLPEAKRRELACVVEILFSEFEDALKGRNAPHRKAGRILKVILFGSYARGDWVDDPIGGYKSDYDLLVVMNHEELADLAEYWGPADDHLLREYQIAKRLTAPANFIVHSMTDVNRQLKKGRPGLRRCAVFAALQDQRRGTGMAERADFDASDERRGSCNERLAKTV
jgi:predicted nucleotidyltransferase